MTPADFTMVATLLKQRSGLIITPDKGYLLESRLTPVARKWNLGGLDGLVQKLRTSNDAAMIKDVVEAMTTNESFFFRDQKPFDLFRTAVLPYMLEKNAARRSLRIWSAACSSGQEAYSLAMILSDQSAKLAGWNIEILGTDLSSEMVNRSISGIYSQFEVQRGLPVTHLVKYFTQDGDKWQIHQKLRDMAKFRVANLLEDIRTLGNFDIIFCRNVLIYFDPPTKKKVLEQMADLMPADGVLYLGGAETVLGITDALKPVSGYQGIYSKSGVLGTAQTALNKVG